MPRKLAQSIYEVSLLTRLLKAQMQLSVPEGNGEDMSEREILILDILDECGEMRVSDILAYFPRTATSTISNDLNNLGKRRQDGIKLISKKINELNEREKIISLTDHGKVKLAAIKKSRAEMFSALVKMLNLNTEQLKVFEEVLDKTVTRMRSELRGS